MTQPRDWPNDAAWARDSAAEEAAQGLRTLRPLLDGERLDSTETLRRIAQAMVKFQKILRNLERVGAKTRPE